MVDHPTHGCVWLRENKKEKKNYESRIKFTLLILYFNLKNFFFLVLSSKLNTYTLI